MRRFGGLVLAIALLGVAPARAAVPGKPACPVFPADNVWHADISALPVSARSGAWLAAMGGGDRHLHPDFGPSDTAQPYGIPYAVVPSTHAKVNVQFDYADESDPGPYPFGPDTPVENGSDAHALMVDGDACRLYELYGAAYHASGSTAGSGAIWDLRSNAMRPSGWTSADAAGLPIFAGLIRRDEVAAGTIDHAIRLTAQQTDRSFVWPARHQAGARSDASLPPMGARFRMKAAVDISHFSHETQVILQAMKRYGLLLADNGSNWYFGAAAEIGWDTTVLDELKSIPASDFDAVDESSLMVSPDSGQARGTHAVTPTTRDAAPRVVGTGVTGAATASTAPPAASTPTSGLPTTSTGAAKHALTARRHGTSGLSIAATIVALGLIVAIGSLGVRRMFRARGGAR